MLAASSIRAVVQQQQRLDSVLHYLSNYGEHVGSLDLESVDRGVCIRQLPHDKLQGLSSLNFSGLRLQLQPGDGFQGVLGAGVLIKQLQFDTCRLLEGEPGLWQPGGLAAALSLLPELHHLSFVNTCFDKSGWLWLPRRLPLQQLTYFELAACPISIDERVGLEFLSSLTSLHELHIQCDCAHTIKASNLAGMHILTCLKFGEYLGSGCSCEPGILACKSQLGHVEMPNTNLIGGSVGTTASEFLSHLQGMQQLTYLDIRNSLDTSEPHPPAAAYSVITASSKLQHLDIRYSTLPTGVWQPAACVPCW